MLLTQRNRGDLLSDRLWNIRREMDRMFDRVWTDSPSAAGNGVSRWTPPVDIVETDGSIECALELPGFRTEDIQVTVEDNVLTVTGERSRRRDASEAEGAYHLFERRYGRFERSFALPQTVDTNDVQAHYENGVLEIVLPKTEEAKPRRIPVEGADGARKIEAGG